MGKRLRTTLRIETANRILNSLRRTALFGAPRTCVAGFLRANVRRSSLSALAQAILRFHPSLQRNHL